MEKEPNNTKKCCYPKEKFTEEFINNNLNTAVAEIPVVSTELSITDKTGALKARLTFGRMDYKVNPGIYAVGNPGHDSIVLVSANYKLSFDALRKELKGLDAWIMVIDTKGINVWCAAGKGTFGTKEIINRIVATKLDKLVSHRKLIVPQLGAPGVAAHEVKKASGFSVVYGPVRAKDIKAFLNADMEATPKMRKVEFSLYDRFILTPAEVVNWSKYLLLAIAAFFLLSLINVKDFNFNYSLVSSLRAVFNLTLSYFFGTVVGPILLPWLPGRSFSVKGLFLGLGLLSLLFLLKVMGNSSLEIIAWIFIVPAIVSFVNLNFTGSSTYTSLSGVRKEMKVAVPIQLAASLMGVVLWIACRFL